MEIVELCESFTSCVSPCLYFDHPGQVGLGNRTLFEWGSPGQCVGGIDEFDSSTSLFKCEHGHGEGVNSPESCVKCVVNLNFDNSIIFNELFFLQRSHYEFHYV